MRRIFVVLGVIFLGLIVLGGLAFFIFIQVSKRLDPESKAFVDKIVPVITRSWNVQDFYPSISPELAKLAPREKIVPLWAILAQRLGPLKEYQGSTGEANAYFNLTTGLSITAAYRANIVCEKAPAEVQIRTIKHNGVWQILSIHVNSDALLP